MFVHLTCFVYSITEFRLTGQRDEEEDCEVDLRYLESADADMMSHSLEMPGKQRTLTTMSKDMSGIMAPFCMPMTHTPLSCLLIRLCRECVRVML